MNQENSFTVIIPTLWKSKRTHKLLRDLIKCEYVYEIILIDNNNRFHEYYEALDKVKLVKPEKNLYVNPSWNLGIEISKTELIAICNDDINFNPNIFGVLTNDIIEQFGFIGMGEGNYNNTDENSEPIITEWRPGVNDWGWGCLIIGKKSNWITVPDDIKIWYGDNFIKEVNPTKKSCLRNFKVETEMSTTTENTEWDDVKKQDYINFIKCLHYGKATN